uniref:Serine/threonine-protein phosphatase 4 regulatory subunit 1 n=1 Tax=Parastrongyloides trichosuri TaxID=131310 RepID=A0A0N4ZP15_PARTI
MEPTRKKLKALDNNQPNNSFRNNCKESQGILYSGRDTRISCEEDNKLKRKLSVKKSKNIENNSFSDISKLLKFNAMMKDNEYCFPLLDEDSYDITGESIGCIKDWFNAIENDLASERVSVMQSVLRVLRLLDITESKDDVEKLIIKMREKAGENEDVAKSCMKCLKPLYITYFHVEYFLNLLDSILIPEVISFFFNAELCESSSMVLLELIENRLISTEAIESTIIPGMFSFLRHFIFSKLRAGRIPTEQNYVKSIVAASHIITKVIDQLERFSDKWIAEEFLPHFSTMLGQDNSAIRKICLPSVRVLSNLLGVTFTEQCLCPHFLIAADDYDWSLRRSSCEILSDILRNVTKEYKDKIVKTFVNLTKDNNQCVGQIAFQNMNAFIDAYMDSGEANGNSKYIVTSVSPPINDFLMKTGLSVKFYVPTCGNTLDDISTYPTFSYSLKLQEIINTTNDDSINNIDKNSLSIVEMCVNGTTDKTLQQINKIDNDTKEITNMMENLKICKTIKNNLENDDNFVIHNLLQKMLQMVADSDNKYTKEISINGSNNVNEIIEVITETENKTIDLDSNKVEGYETFVESFDVETRIGKKRSSGYFYSEISNDDSLKEICEEFYKDIDYSDMDISTEENLMTDCQDTLAHAIDRESEVSKYLNSEEINFIKNMKEFALPECILCMYIEVETIASLANGEWLNKCAETLVKTLRIIGSNNWVLLKGVYYFLLFDVGEKVSRILAENIGELAEVLAPKYEEDVLRIYDQLKTYDYETQNSLISNVFDLVKVLSPESQDKICSELHRFGIRNVDNVYRYKWRNRDIYMQECCKMVDHVSIKTVNDYFVPSAMALATDQIAQVRHTATHLLSKIFVKFILSELMIAEQNNESCTDTSDMPLTDGLLNDLRNSFRKSYDWKRRQVYMKFCEFVLDDPVVPSEFIHNTLWSDISLLSKDDVINVRFILARIIKKASTASWSKNNNLMKDIEKTVNSRHLYEFDPQLKNEMRTTNNNMLNDEWNFLKERKDRINDQEEKFYEHMALLKCGYNDSYGMNNTEEYSNMSADNSDMDISGSSNA